MNAEAALLLAILLSSFVTGVLIFTLPEASHRLRTGLNLLGAGSKLVFVALLVRGVYAGREYAVSWTMAPGVEFALGADANSVLFVTLSTILWLFTTLYAIGYLEDSPHRSRFFGFFSMCVSATIGLALAANLVTFLIFYELLTLATFPLVVHRGTPATMRAGKVYMAYTLGGGATLLLAVAWLQSIAGPIAFTEGGALEHVVASHPAELRL
ncbi:MAG: hypothetical protein MUP61_08565, partial [Burkholderiales bacterium]|nr:hypothetical protein [Burkholderiales bacterium]